MSKNHINQAALLVIDVQQGVVDSMGFGLDYMNRVSQAIETARTTSIPVIYVRIAYREGAPEISPNNRMLYNFAKSGTMMKTAATSQIHSLIAPKSGDIIITKSRVSAFTGSELDLVLRSLKIDHLILSGNATRMGILATFFEAADKDYSLTVLSDCCADSNQAVHDLLMTEVFPLQANVVSLEQWINQLPHPVNLLK
jgi:nicotinamidase-related amidase